MKRKRAAPALAVLLILALGTAAAGDGRRENARSLRLEPVKTAPAPAGLNEPEETKQGTGILSVILPESARGEAEAATPVEEAIRMAATKEGKEEETRDNIPTKTRENGEKKSAIATFGLVTLKGPGTGTAEPEADDAERPGIPQAGTEERPEEEPADGTGPESGSAGMWIYGPEKMKAGARKFFKARFDGESPGRKKLTWSLDCGPETARVFGNGQVWIRPKTAPGTVVTLTCRAENRRAPGGPPFPSSSASLHPDPWRLPRRR